jgi:DNA-binding NarL/FixJ family response regulator
MRDVDPSFSVDASVEHYCSFAILCGVPAIERMIVGGLEAAGFHFNADAATLVLVDAPYGFAMLKLEGLNQAERRVIIATDNPCPEYWQDLLDLQPAVLLVGNQLEAVVAKAIVRVAHGETYRITPHQTTELTPTERAILRGIARGLSNRQIATWLDMAPHTVANTLTGVYTKIGRTGGAAATLYYWGRQDLIKDMLCPPPCKR